MQIFEIFDSIQGEGPLTGYPTTFIRVSGCSLGCNWCDTIRAQPANVGTAMTVEQVFEHVSGKCYHVCITGGEPFEQSQEVVALAELLDAEGYDVSIETNGSIIIPDFDCTVSIVADLKTPSSGVESLYEALVVLWSDDVIKAVIKTQEDLDYAKAVFTRLRNDGCLAQFYFSVEDGTFADKIIALDYLDARMGIQLHKILNVQ